MKKTITILLSVFFLAAFSVNAQMDQNQSNQQKSMMMQKSDMMQNGMMQGMMDNAKCPMCGQMMNPDMPMQKYGMMVNKLPTMQQQLALTNEQVDQLYDLQTDFKKQQIDYQAELRKKQMKLKGLLNDMAPISKVKTLMKDCADTKINMKAAAYETAGKMKSVLTNEQKEKMKTMMMQMHDQEGMMNQDKDGLDKDEHNH